MIGIVLDSTMFHSNDIFFERSREVFHSLCHVVTLSQLMLSLNLITPDTKQELADIQSVTCTLAAGPVKILPHHAPTIATVEPGKLYAVRKDGIKSYELTSPGLLKIERDVITVVS